MDLTESRVKGKITPAQKCIMGEGSNRVTDEQSGLAAQAGKLTRYGLAMVGGAGMTLLILGASLGVIFGAGLDAQSTHTLGLLLVIGLFLLILAIGFWLGWVRPFERFDDINVPAEPEHH